MSFAGRLAVLELRRQAPRLLLLAAALAVGFGAFFATDIFAAKVLRSVATESRALLGGDVVLSSNGRLAEELRARVATHPLVAGSVEIVDLLTMAGLDDKSRLVELRAVSGTYPLAGRLVTTPPFQQPGLYVDRGLAEGWGLQPADGTTADASLLGSRRGLRIGAEIHPIKGIVQQSDDQPAGGMAVFPRVILDLPTAERLGLMTNRSRVSGRQLVLLKPGVPLDAAVRELKAVAGKGIRVRGHLEAAGNLAAPIRNLTRFGQLLGLLTLFLAAMGAWAILVAFLESKTKEAAILRALGAPPGLPVAAFGLLALLLVLTSLGMGYGLGVGVSLLLNDSLPALLRQGGLPPPPFLEMGLALVALGLLLLPALLRLGRVRPLALLRETEAPVNQPWVRLLAPLGAAAVASLLVVRVSPTVLIGLATAALLGLLLAGLWGLARLLVALYRRLLDRLPLSLRLGLGQLGARPSLTALLMAVMGLAVFLTLSSQFVKDDLVAPLAAQKGGGQRPNLFLIDIASEERPAMRARLEAVSGHPVLDAPVVRGKLISVAGRVMTQRHIHDGQEVQEEMRTREQNLSWREALSPSEQVVAGAWWPKGGEPRAEASLEQRFAERIGAKLGDELVFDVFGQEVKVKVASLRKVKWTTLQINFFILMHPSVLEGAPAMGLMAAEVDDDKARSALLGELAAKHPTVTAVDVGEVVARVGRVLDLIAMVARVLAGVMLASALLVLGSSLLAGRSGRARDAALLRAVGASDRTLNLALAWEFLVLGGSAAGLAGLVAYVGARLYATKVMELESDPSPMLALTLLAGTALLTLAVGYLGTRRALNHKPLELLRGE